MMTLGTGMGTAVRVEGRPLRGAHGQAGILGGHLLANLQGARCQCGAVGCLETEGASWSLPGRIREREGFPSSMMANAEVLDYANLFRCAAAGDGLAVEVRDASIRAWSAGVVALVHAYDPELVLLGGGVMASAGEILPQVADYVRQHAWTPWGSVRVAAAKLGNDAGLMGAAWLASRSRIQR
jgi:glucokinase